VFSDYSAVLKGEEEQDFLRRLFLRLDVMKMLRTRGCRLAWST
jgi:hypothetical protein